MLFACVFQVWKMAGLAWGSAWLLSTPQAYIFSEQIEHQNGTNISRCKSHFDVVGIGHRRAYLTFIVIINFILPLITVTVCYVRIFFKIAEKVKESKMSKKPTMKPGKVHLQSTTSSSLPKAKVKTLKMTIVIVMNFIICSAPYYSAEMILSYGDWKRLLPPVVWGLFAAVTIANSVTNPYIFLCFNANNKFVRGVCPNCPCVNVDEPRRRDFDSSVTMNTEVSRTQSRYVSYAPDVVEMAHGQRVAPHDAKFHNNMYTRMHADTE